MRSIHKIAAVASLIMTFGCVSRHFIKDHDPVADIWVSTEDEVKCDAFKTDYRFFRGNKGELGLPTEAFMRLVAVKGDSIYMLNTRTSLVNFVEVNTERKALSLVRLFSSAETHYLFDDADFLELPKYSKGSSFWYDDDSVRRTRAAGVPLDTPTVMVTKTDGVYRVERYAMDWHRNVLRVVETVSSNGTYAIIGRQVMATNIWAVMPMYE